MSKKKITHSNISAPARILALVLSILVGGSALLTGLIYFFVKLF